MIGDLLVGVRAGVAAAHAIGRRCCSKGVLGMGRRALAFAKKMPKKPPASFVCFHVPKPGITGTFP